MKNKLMLAGASILVLLLAVGFGIYNTAVQNQPVPIAEAATQPEEISSSSAPEVPAITIVSYSESQPAPIVSPSSSVSAVEPPPKPSVITVTPNNNGGKDHDTSRPEYSRPPDDDTIYDEPEDDSNGSSSTPEKPQGGQPGDNGGNISTPDAPQGGGKPGQIYVPGFGWMDDPGTGSGTVENAPNAGTGDVIGE